MSIWDHFNIEELSELSVDPSEIRLPGALYDELLDQIESVADEEEQEQD